jgi:hypothetical protein
MFTRDPHHEWTPPLACEVLEVNLRRQHSNPSSVAAAAPRGEASVALERPPEAASTAREAATSERPQASEAVGAEGLEPPTYAL